MLIAAGLCEKPSEIGGFERSEDIDATVACLKALGATFEITEHKVNVVGADPVRRPEGAVFPCGACGSTLRFLIPLAMLSERTAVFTGTERLLARPLTEYAAIAEKQGLVFDLQPERLSLRGGLRAGIFDVAGDVSSQFLTGLLFALPLLSVDSYIRIRGALQSRPYVEMTRFALKNSGVRTEWNGPDELFVPGGQAYGPVCGAVEGDWSNAAVFYALASFGYEVRVSGTDAASLQGDRVCVALLAELARGETGIDLTDCPDLGPVLFAAAAASHGAVFTGTRRLKWKESDRVSAMAEVLAAFGARAEDRGESVRVIAASPLKAPVAPVDAHNDHRIAMAASILLLRTGGVLTGAEAVNKSFPAFYERLCGLGVKLEYEA